MARQDLSAFWRMWLRWCLWTIPARAWFSVLWFGIIHGRCVVCGVPAPRSGPGFGVCDKCLGLPREWVDLTDEELADRLAEEIRL